MSVYTLTLAVGSAVEGSGVGLAVVGLEVGLAVVGCLSKSSQSYESTICNIIYTSSYIIHIIYKHTHLTSLVGAVVGLEVVGLVVVGSEVVGCGVK